MKFAIIFGKQSVFKKDLKYCISLSSVLHVENSSDMLKKKTEILMKNLSKTSELKKTLIVHYCEKNFSNVSGGFIFISFDNR